MSPPKHKKRALRLADSPKLKNLKLFNFALVNQLLYLDKPIPVHLTSLGSSHLYQYYKQACKLPEISPKETDLRYQPLLLPRRQRTRADPLPDDWYSVFHRRMAKEEKSMAESDRTRVMMEIENLKDQLRLLLQNDWARQLPRITFVEDKKDMDEMTRKRKLTQTEIRRMLSKYVNWEERNKKLLREFKRFEDQSPAENGLRRSYRDVDLDDESENSDDSDDSDEKVLVNLQDLKRQREAARMWKVGSSTRILLRNGYDILLQPDQIPRIVESGMYIS